MNHYRSLLAALALVTLSVLGAGAQTPAYPMGSVIGDAQAGAPELAARGPWAVGVKTLVLANPSQTDIIASTKTGKAVTGDRSLKVEVWYPSPAGASAQITSYTDYLGRADQAGSLIPFSYAGRASRDIGPDKKGGPYPLVIVSHGYPGSRYLLSYLGENLASKGYVVAAIGHTDSTYEDVGSFTSTLVNRSPDQRFAISALLELSARDPFWSGLLDPAKVGLIGYSMGGYGTLRTLGAGCNDRAKNYAGDFVSSILASPTDKGDARIKAAVLFAPWGGIVGGGPTGLWDKDSLGRIATPTLWVAGSRDDVAGYSGIVSLFDGAIHSRRWLLTYANALHNVDPNPAPPEATTLAQASRWSDPVWDSRRMNNINEHFVTAFLNFWLKGDQKAAAYLDVKVEDSNAGIYALNKDGTQAPNHTYWPGFPARTASGLQLRSVTP